MADNWVQRAVDATRFTASGSMAWTGLTNTAAGAFLTIQNAVDVWDGHSAW